MEGLADFEIELLRGKNFAHLVTLGADGSPRSRITWVDVDPEAGLVLVNSAVGRAKDRDLRRDPRMSLSVQDGSDGYRYVAILRNRCRVRDRRGGRRWKAHSLPPPGADGQASELMR